MKIKKKYGLSWKLIAIAIAIFLSYSCCSITHNLKSQDATHISQQSFALIMITANFKKTICDPKTQKCKHSDVSVAAKGSSVIIHHRDGETYIASVAHVCNIDPPRKFLAKLKLSDIETKIKITLYDIWGNSHRGEVVYSDDSNDICILKSSGVWGKTTILAEKPPIPGERVFNVAAPFGIWVPGMVPIMEGLYSGTDGDGNEYYTIPTRPGSSGSPIFNHDGKLIGLIHSASIMFESIGLGCKFQNLKEIIRSHAYLGSNKCHGCATIYPPISQ
tara:strand:+ start:306 stop:1130 length:825 start_codon:yes stop_codon:yes gene_type:complete